MCVACVQELIYIAVDRLDLVRVSWTADGGRGGGARLRRVEGGWRRGGGGTASTLTGSWDADLYRLECGVLASIYRNFPISVLCFSSLFLILSQIFLFQTCGFFLAFSIHYLKKVFTCYLSLSLNIYHPCQFSEWDIFWQYLVDKCSFFHPKYTLTEKCVFSALKHIFTFYDVNVSKKGRTNRIAAFV